MYKFFIALLTVLSLFTGCSQKTNEYAKSTDTMHEQALTQTQNRMIKDGKKTKVYFVTTLLKNVDQNITKKEEGIQSFIVSAYVPSSEDQSIYNNFVFKINSKEPISVTKIKQDDAILSLIPESNPWSKYYLIKAPIDETIRGVHVELIVLNIGSTKMEFNNRRGDLKFTVF